MEKTDSTVVEDSRLRAVTVPCEAVYTTTLNGIFHAQRKGVDVGDLLRHIDPAIIVNRLGAYSLFRHMAPKDFRDVMNKFFKVGSEDEG